MGQPRTLLWTKRSRLQESPTTAAAKRTTAILQHEESSLAILHRPASRPCERLPWTDSERPYRRPTCSRQRSVSFEPDCPVGPMPAAAVQHSAGHAKHNPGNKYRLGHPRLPETILVPAPCSQVFQPQSPRPPTVVWWKYWPTSRAQVPGPAL